MVSAHHVCGGARSDPAAAFTASPHEHEIFTRGAEAGGRAEVRLLYWFGLRGRVDASGQLAIDVGHHESLAAVAGGIPQVTG